MDLSPSRRAHKGNVQGDAGFAFPENSSFTAWRLKDMIGGDEDDSSPEETVRRRLFRVVPAVGDRFLPPDSYSVAQWKHQ